MKVLVTFAVQQEFAPWRGLRSFEKTVVAGGDGTYPVFRATIVDTEVRAALTGIGYYPARRAMHTLLENDPPDFCISSGLAGALKPKHQPGDILAARWVRPVQGTRRVESDAALLELALALGARRAEAFVSSKHVVVSALEKYPLGTFADAVEMESFNVLRAAQGRGIPAVAVRAISDGANEDMPCDFNRALDERGRLRAARVAVQIALRPQRLPALVRFGRQSRRAAEQLAAFLDRYVSALGTMAREMEFESPVAAT